MIRRIVIAVLAAASTLVGLAGAASAKPKIAILGLEVISADGNPDAVTTNTAKLLTQKLRERANGRTGPYELAPQSKKDLLEMKLLSNCSDEGRGCMAAIGRELHADVLMYGKIEKRSGEGYHVNVKLQDTKSGDMIKVTEVTVPFPDRQPDKIGPYASRLYGKLVGAPLEGSLLLHVKNVDKGTIYIDGQIRGNLSAGSAKIPGITEGQRTLTVEAEGFKSYSRAIDIVADQELDLEIGLEGQGGGGGRPGGTSRALFWVSAGLTAATAAGWTVEGFRVITTLKDEKLKAMREYSGSVQLSKQSGCADAKAAFKSGADTSAEMERIVSACNDGKRGAAITNAFIGGTVAAAALATLFYYKGYIAPKDEYKDSPDNVASRRHKKEPETSIRVIPRLGPNSVGAGVTVEF